MLTLFNTDGAVRNFDDAQACDAERYAGLFRHLLERGIYIAPSQFEAMFVSLAHGDEEIDRTIEAAGEFFSCALSSGTTIAQRRDRRVAALGRRCSGPSRSASMSRSSRRSARSASRSASRRSTRATSCTTARRASSLPPTQDTALLLGDYLYAHGLVRIASCGEVDAVADLSELISLSQPAARRGRRTATAPLWAATAALLGSGQALDAPRAALRLRGDPSLLEMPPRGLPRAGCAGRAVTRGARRPAEIDSRRCSLTSPAGRDRRPGGREDRPDDARRRLRLPRRDHDRRAHALAAAPAASSVRRSPPSGAPGERREK